MAKANRNSNHRNLSPSTPEPLTSANHAPRWVRAAQIVRNRKHPDRPYMLDISIATLWRWVKDGRFPSPIKIGPNTTAWTTSSIDQWQQEQMGDAS